MDEATAKAHKCFNEEAWKKAGGSDKGLPLLRLVIPKPTDKAGISFTKTCEIAKVNPGGLG